MATLNFLSPRWWLRRFIRKLSPSLLSLGAASYFATVDGPQVLISFSTSARKESLASLFAKHGSDKGWEGAAQPPYPWRPHNYADFYDLIFDDRRERVLSIVECGIGTKNTDVTSNMTSDGIPGASLRAWRDYFPLAHVYGLDIDRTVLFKENRISTFEVDQLQPEKIAAFWTESGLSEVDVMIDDGLHTFEAGVSLFKNSYDKLHRAGIYVIEDVSRADIPRYFAVFEGQKFGSNVFHATAVQLYREGAPLGDNTLLVIRRSCLE